MPETVHEDCLGHGATAAAAAAVLLRGHGPLLGQFAEQLYWRLHTAITAEALAAGACADEPVADESVDHASADAPAAHEPADGREDPLG